MALYHFIWDTFCDWYIECTKPILQGDHQNSIEETQKTLAWVLAKIYHLMHPYMPYISEELWTAIGGKGLLIEAHWPKINIEIDKQVCMPIDWMIESITKIRGLKSEMQIPASTKLSIDLYGLDTDLSSFISQNESLFKTLARLESIKIKEGPIKTEKSAQLVMGNATVVIPLEGLIDIDAEKMRLEKEIQKLEKELISLDKRLRNPQFKEKAPTEIIDELTERQTTFTGELEKNKAALLQLD
jgi:valyl-tRNA synthetase